MSEPTTATVARTTTYRRVFLSLTGYPDVKTPYGTQVLQPRNAVIEYVKIDGEPWRYSGAEVYGPRRLISGKLGKEVPRSSYMAPASAKHEGVWLCTLIDRYTPTD